MDLAKDTRDSFAYYAARYWLTDLAVDDPTSSAVRARIYAALRRASIPLARPLRRRSSRRTKMATTRLGSNDFPEGGCRPSSRWTSSAS
jgi:hypothetical protein